ncbi:MAG TPA: hypothetical protein VK937_24730 [Candidatus Limnocylindria bacterium]|nr:hypothetical protein [Candidatus Limnocylindria bacterium]
MRRKPFWVMVCLLVTLVLCDRSWAQQTGDNKSAVNPLVRVLQAKGILTAEEVAQISQASSTGDADQRLAKLLLIKGVISQADYDQTVGTSGMMNASNAGTSSPTAIAAVYRVPINNGVGVAPTGPPPQETKVIPAVAPLRVLPIDVPKQGGLIPDIKLGSGANMKLYGFFKASAVSDTASSGGPTFGSQDFPLPLLLADTGPTSDPQVHIKARSFRIGSQFEWVPKNSNIVVTGRVEADYEGDFTNQNSVNISSPRNGQLRTRLAWARLDTKLGGSLPWFAEFGQDWTLYSSTLPSLFETTGTAIAMGALWERAPMFRTGVQFHSGNLKVQPEFAIVLPVAGTSALTDEQRARFGDRAGPESNQPALESRIVFQFPLSTGWQGVVPAQVIFSGHHARINEIIPFGNLPTTVIPGAAGCATATCSIRDFFPRGLQLDHPQNIWTAEAQLPTPWVTFTGKYYQGGDLRFPFGGQLNDVFNDLNGTVAIPGTLAPGVTVATVTALDSRTVLFGCTGATGTGATFNCNGNPIVSQSFRPVRGLGGFLEASFPLSRIFNFDSEGHNSGWVLHLSYGTDRTRAQDVRRSGANGLARTDLDSGSLTYRLNKWVTFVQETSYINTRAANHGGKIFRGIPATQAHSWRNEFGTIFTF